MRDRRLAKDDQPIYTALRKCVYEFAKADVLPSDLQALVISAHVFDKLVGEGVAIAGQYAKDGVVRDRYIEIIGIKITRGT